MFKKKAKEQKPHPKTCERCPHRYSELGCPSWILPEAGFVETNIATGEERLIEGCFYAVLPRLFQHVIAAANRPAAAFDKLATLTCAIGMKIAPQAVEQHRVPKLENTDQPRLINGQQPTD